METVLAESFVASVFLLLSFTLHLFLSNMDGLVVDVGFYLVLSSVTAGHMFFVQTRKCLLGLLLGRWVKRTERYMMTNTKGAVGCKSWYMVDRQFDRNRQKYR